MSARYWIAQYVGDLFRNEPRNVGVLVEMNGQQAFRFIGEDENSAIDGRKLKGFQFPDVYRQWVEYWRASAAKAGASSLVDTGGAHFRVGAGGEVTDVGRDTPDAVANYLYTMLVDTGGLMEALQPLESDEPARTAFAAVVGDALMQANILGDENRIPVPHPVKRAVQISGRIPVPHTPAFVQENGRLYVMETVDFTTSKKKLARDHAGWSAYMFSDIRAARLTSGIEAIALVRILDQDRGVEEVANGLALLKNECDVVYWDDPKAQASFIEDRRQVAFS